MTPFGRASLRAALAVGRLCPKTKNGDRPLTRCGWSAGLPFR